ncbi:MAG TPA: YegS/Rv2252/BmrU family lipid kinase [Gemmatimonadaceae bacterium]|jgi:diacylglycerol kinase (ATP)|nr:YegS/Rv2252/BmrU family lipid kinase [Gemmatimonadaceae bacterium]
MRSKHIALVVHGARVDRPELRHLVGWVREKGHLVEVLPTFEAGDAAALAATAARRGVDVVAAAGGDGTVNEVVNGLDGYDVPLGIIPVGTANDFARQVGIPADADHAMDVILQRKPKRLDTASLNGRRFLNVSTGGVGAEATAETPAEVKESLGALAYAISGMRKLADFRAQHARFVGDEFEYDGEFLMFAVGITRSTGGGTLVTPMASATDGLLDLCIVERMSRGDFARTVLRVKRGEHIGHEGVHYVQLKAVRIEAEEPMAVNVDGEMSNGQRLAYRARARDLWVHLVHLPGESD